MSRAPLSVSNDGGSGPSTGLVLGVALPCFVFIVVLMILCGRCNNGSSMTGATRSHGGFHASTTGTHAGMFATMSVATAAGATSSYGDGGGGFGSGGGGGGFGGGSGGGC